MGGGESAGVGGRAKRRCSDWNLDGGRVEELVGDVVSRRHNVRFVVTGE